MTLTVIIIYLMLVMVIGASGHRLFRKTNEDYFVAGRSIGPFVLLMSLFGTNMTAFALLGASGQAYRYGIGVFALMASSSAIIIPTIFFFLGTRLWKLGKKFGYLTQVQFFRDRFQSSNLGLFLFLALVGLLVPYLLIGLIGAGDTLGVMTGMPFWLGSLLVTLVVFSYVTFSGMRGTAWVNTFQTMVFMTLGAVATWLIISKLGGLSGVMAELSESNPELLARGDKIHPAYQFSYLFIPLSAGMFPHIFTHWLTAEKVENFKIPIVFYPVCMVVVWVPSVLLGVSGHIDFPDLTNQEAGRVLIQLVDKHAAGLLGGLLAAGVIAAIMSSLDSQTLSLGNMFTQDIVRHYNLGAADDTKSVWWGRLFVCAILGLTYLLAQVTGRGIFALGIWSFTGYASLLPIGIAAVFWRRATKWGAYASLIVTTIGWIYFYSSGSPTAWDTGMRAVALIFPASALAMVVVSLLTKPPTNTEKFFP